MLSIYNWPMAFDAKRFTFSDIYSNFFGDLTASDDAVTDESIVSDRKVSLNSYKSVAKADELKLTVDVPGMDPSTIALKVQKNVVRIVGNVDGKPQTRRFNIVSQYDCDNASASYEFGRVLVTIPAYKQEQPETKTIPIKIR